MRRSRSVHPIPLACRIFGHRWRNDHSFNPIFPDYCLRAHARCPGDGHVWEHGHVDEDDLAHERCGYPDCDATLTWQVPDMSLGLVPPPPPPRYGCLDPHRWEPDHVDNDGLEHQKCMSCDAHRVLVVLTIKIPTIKIPDSLLPDQPTTEKENPHD